MSDEQQEVLDTVMVPSRLAWYLILDCGHWYEWEGVTTSGTLNTSAVPKAGDSFSCPDCHKPHIVKVEAER